MNIGTSRRFLRDRLPLQILRGFYLTEPGKLTFLAPPATNEVDEIKSGMLLVVADVVVNGATVKGFRRAQIADNSTAQTFYIAVHDANNLNVQASGLLVGLDCSDTFEVQTGHFLTGADVSYSRDLALTAGANGVVKAATNGDIIIGYVSAVGTNSNGSFPYVGLTPGLTDPANATMLQFKTAQSGIKYV